MTPLYIFFYWVQVWINLLKVNFNRCFVNCQCLFIILYGVFIHPTIWITIINSRCAYILYTKQPLKIYMCVCVCTHYQRVDSYIHHLQYVMKQSIVLILKRAYHIIEREAESKWLHLQGSHTWTREINQLIRKDCSPSSRETIRYNKIS